MNPTAFLPHLSRIDMQRYFSGIASPILESVMDLIRSCRSLGMKVIFSWHGDRNVQEEGGMLANF
jgi:hypothetical protein